MRPVRRGPSPQAGEFVPYGKAKHQLLVQLGSYCSYCERRVDPSLAVEHIQPKDLPLYEGLIGTWTNYLLACVNCNSTKSNKDVQFDTLLFPDRDNTFYAFTYTSNGKVEPSVSLAPGLADMALSTLQLTGLDKALSEVLDDNGKQIVVDRVSKRMEVWGIALECKQDLHGQPDNDALKRSIIRTAIAEGLFSIWMTVFRQNEDMLQRFVAGFPGTMQSGCFTFAPYSIVSPHPNYDALAQGGKV